MILPFEGVAFAGADDGDARDDPEARRRLSAALGIPADWVFVRQVHGADVVAATAAGTAGAADAIFTTVPLLPLAITTADCFPVSLHAEGAVGIAHAGWRGAAAGVVPALRRAMIDAGHPPARAAVGPGIGPCCFEVGSEVAEVFPGSVDATTWGTRSVDLAGVLVESLDGLDVWTSGTCTMSDEGFHSFRRDGTAERQVAVAWLRG